MKLYIDDLRKPPEGWELARTITEAIRILATGMVEEVSLDHDIFFSFPTETIFAGYLSNETFTPVAHYIAIMSKKPKVRFHTGNIAAGEAMAKIIGCEFDHEMHHNL